MTRTMKALLVRHRDRIQGPGISLLIFWELDPSIRSTPSSATLSTVSKNVNWRKV